MSVLAHYYPSLPVQLAGNSSVYGIGAVISHILPEGLSAPSLMPLKHWWPVSANMHNLKVALSLVYRVQRFLAYLYGRPFTPLTDNKALTIIFASSKSVPPLAVVCLKRWALLPSSYDCRIVFRPTKAHANADGLSRLSVPHKSDEPCLPDPKLFNI